MAVGAQEDAILNGALAASRTRDDVVGVLALLATIAAKTARGLGHVLLPGLAIRVLVVGVDLVAPWLTSRISLNRRTTLESAVLLVAYWI